MATTDIQRTMSELEAKHADSLRARLHGDRAVAIEVTHRSISTACDHEVAALKNAIEAVEQARAANIEAATAGAEACRGEQANALLAEIFDSDSMPRLVNAYFQSRTPENALAVHQAWAQFSKRAEQELGEPLDERVLGAMVADKILEQPGMAAEINHLCQSDFGFCNIAYALYDVCRGGAALDIHKALEAAFTFMSENATRRYRAGGLRVPEKQCIARYALRREHATKSELNAAYEAFDKACDEERARLAQLNSPPPSPRVFDNNQPPPLVSYAR